MSFNKYSSVLSMLVMTRAASLLEPLKNISDVDAPMAVVAVVAVVLINAEIPGTLYAAQGWVEAMLDGAPCYEVHHHDAGFAPV